MKVKDLDGEEVEVPLWEVSALIAMGTGAFFDEHLTINIVYNDSEDPAPGIVGWGKKEKKEGDEEK
jgi:hypothetical protein